MSKLEKLVQQFLQRPAEVKFEDVRYILEAFEFEEKRSKASHHIFRDFQGRTITISKKGGQKVKGVYVQKIVELLNLEEWNNDEVETEEEADRKAIIRILFEHSISYNNLCRYRWWICR